MSTNWLITGGCGFIGSRLIKKILSENTDDYIRLVDNCSVGSPSDLDDSLLPLVNFRSETNETLSANPGKIDFFQGDILDSDLALRLGRGMDVCVHLAANTGVLPSIQNPIMDCNTNIIGTLNYLESARINKIKKFILASSGAPLGDVPPPIHEKMVAHPKSPYGASKLAGEGYCQAYFHSYGLNYSALRFSNVYGPGSKRKNSIVAKIIKSFFARDEFFIYGNGEQTRDFLYIDDLVFALFELSQRYNQSSMGIFQVASSIEVSVNDVIKKINSHLFAKYSEKVLVGNIGPQDGEVLRSFSDTTKLKSAIPWYNLTSLDAGIELTISYFSELFENMEL